MEPNESNSDAFTGLESDHGIGVEEHPADPAEMTRTAHAPGETVLEGERDGSAGAAGPRLGWWMLAGSAALVLLLLTGAVVYLFSRRPVTIDQVVILTVPSGAEIKLNAKDYGRSPVKIERLEAGWYTVEISKDGFEAIVEQVEMTADSQPLEFKLKPVLPSFGLSPEEQIRQYQQYAEESFERGRYAIPYEESALHYADSIRSLDFSSQFAEEMRERVRGALHQTAKTAATRGDLAQAQQVYSTLIDNYPEDEEARAGLARVENSLVARRGEVRDLVRKAEAALQSGNLIQPSNSSAYYYSRQALAIDRQNAQAVAVRNRVKEQLMAEVERFKSRGDVGGAISRLEQIREYFPDDRQLASALKEMTSRRAQEEAREGDPDIRRTDGLARYRHGDFEGAIRDLEFAVANDRGTADVIFALAHSYMKLGQNDKAALYFTRVPPFAGDSHRSSIALLGEIANQRGDTTTALERYREARRLGGSILFPASTLDDRIESIERRQREKAAEPSPVTIQVRHLHGGILDRTCSGTLSVTSTGVRYEGTKHQYSYNLVGVGLQVTGSDLIINRREKFRASSADAERFRDELAKYQAQANR